MKGLTDLMKQAQEMQKSIEAAQQDLVAKVVIGSALMGKIKVWVNGRYNCSKVEISDDLMQETKPVIQDAIAAAFNDAANKIEEYSKTKMSGLMAGMDLPTDMGSLT